MGDIMRRRGMMKEASGGGGVLPAGYTELKKLISNKNQQIDTGFYPTFATDIYFRFVFEVLEVNRTQIYFGNYDDKNSNQISQLVQVSNRFRLDRYFAGSSAYTGTITINTDYEYVQDHDQVTCNGKTLTVPSDYSATRQLSIFARGGEASTNAVMAFYEAIYIDNTDTIALHLLPALRDYDSKPGLYDVARDVFLTNAITGHEFGYETMDGTVVNPS